MENEPTNLQEILDRIEKAAGDGRRVSLGGIFKEVGSRSFGPLLLLAGLITLAPIIGDIPGVPTIMALFVLLTAIQLLARRDHFWLPKWMLKRSVKQERLGKTIKWMRSPARFLDRFLRPRLTMFTQDAGIYLIAVICIAISLAMPVMELVPFSANFAGAALTAFGLSLIAKDGLWALIAIGITVSTFVFIGHGLF